MRPVPRDTKCEKCGFENHVDCSEKIKQEMKSVDPTNPEFDQKLEELIEKFNCALSRTSM